MSQTADIVFGIILLVIVVPLIGVLLFTYREDRKRYHKDKPYVKLPGDRQEP